MIHLRSPKEIDAGLWSAWSADEDVRRFLEIRWSGPETVEAAQIWIDALDEGTAFSVFYGAELIGAAWVRWADHDAHGVRTMTVLIRNKAYWGRGIAAEVSEELIRRFPCRMWMRITYGANRRMQRVMEKSGFLLAGEIPNYYRFEGGFTSRQIWVRYMTDQKE